MNHDTCTQPLTNFGSSAVIFFSVIGCVLESTWLVGARNRTFTDHKLHSNKLPTSISPFLQLNWKSSQFDIRVSTFIKTIAEVFEMKFVLFYSKKIYEMPRGSLELRQSYKIYSK